MFGDTGKASIIAIVTRERNRMNIGNLLSRNAHYNPDKPALLFENQSYTYGQLNRNVNQLANTLLDRGIGKGNKVATLLPNCVELLEIYWAGGQNPQSQITPYS
jgi:long-chain acyl-CoA synthetase